MPSAARQRLPADLWRQGSQKHSPVPMYHTQEITVHASPGNCDVFQEEKLPSSQGNIKQLNKSSRKASAIGRGGSPNFVTRRGSISMQRTGFSDSESSSSGKNTHEMSTSARSDSYLRYNPTCVYHAYAMESTVAPHPSEVPFPPLEWLQSYTRHSHSSVISNVSLKAILGCHVAA